ncbi:DNA helicase-2/ATP-dependent DNA helicase PcrA [Elusimicrobium posterum]|uniref:UvrD-helicase domain-containing protein n=1 Tax=Elusimicrobium posterum TaxID=3116653 RepID=UPI003C75B8DF
MKNKLIIAAAGSGKTTYIVNDSKTKKNGNVLITTYTEENEGEIRKRFKRIPSNITIQTWFSFLIKHGLKPFQGSFNEKLFDYKVTGLNLVNTASGIQYRMANGIGVPFSEETNVLEHYFSKEGKIYSDKLSKFVVGGGGSVSKDKRKQFINLVIGRLERIYTDIYVDEAQDLAGYDLEFIKALFQSKINVILVADPRQVVYLTHIEAKYKKYREGKIEDFIKDECKKICSIDTDTLSQNHRCHQDICCFADKLYPSLKTTNASKEYSDEHCGVFFVKTKDIPLYVKKYTPMQLCWNIESEVMGGYPSINFGKSKGLEFERVLIYPPKSTVIAWLKNPTNEMPFTTRSKFYVALTRAKKSAAIVCDEDIQMEGITAYKQESDIK